MKQRRFEVYIGKRHIDTVHADEDIRAADLRRSLINHDGLPSTISVYRCNDRNTAFDDVARFSHPDELL
jgi:hypothetical protein